MQIPRHTYFEQMPVGSIKAPSGHFLHFAPARPDDDSPYKEFQKLEAQQIAAGGAPFGAETDRTRYPLSGK